MQNSFSLICFIAAWIGVAYIFAKVGGWSRLSAKYSSHDLFSGSWKKWQSARFGVIDYCNCIWIGIASEGLYLKTGPLFFFRVFHPPLCVPWSAIESIEERKYWWTWTRVLEIKFIDCRVIIMLKSDVLDEARPFLGDKIKLLAKA